MLNSTNNTATGTLTSVRVGRIINIVQPRLKKKSFRGYDNAVAFCFKNSFQRNHNEMSLIIPRDNTISQ